MALPPKLSSHLSSPKASAPASAPDPATQPSPAKGAPSEPAAAADDLAEFLADMEQGEGQEGEQDGDYHYGLEGRYDEHGNLYPTAAWEGEHDWDAEGWEGEALGEGVEGGKVPEKAESKRSPVMEVPAKEVPAKETSAKTKSK